MIFSGDRFSGHYAMFINETGTGRDYYEGGTPPAKERDCPNDIVNYLVAYRKPIIVDSEVIVEEADTEEPVSQRYSSEEEEESCEGSDDQFYYPLPARDVFGLKCGKLFKEATKGQGIHSRYSNYILKENHYRLSDEDAVSLMMNKCHYYPKKLFMHEYDRMHWMWSHDNLIQLLTQFFGQLESLSLCLRQGKDIDDYITYTPGGFKEALELVYTCCFSSPVLSSLVILDPVRDDMVHRRRKILNIGGALDIIAREIFWPRPHFVQTTPIWALTRHAGKSFLAVAMKERTVSQANHSLQLLKDS